MLIENFPLKTYHTFSIDVYAKYFSEFNTLAELHEVLSVTSTSQSILILGGGSNILFTKNFDGLVLKNNLKGITVIDEDSEFVFVQAGAGENWHQFVLYCLQNNFSGIENLSLIPGNVGASPMQNIGAYGVELKDVFYDLEAFDLKERSVVKFNAEECEFGYRESIFKSKYRDRFVILNVTFKLRKTPHFNITYGAIEQELKNMNVSGLSIQAISQAVINIRRSKLPDPAIIGNAGSFFKNPQIDIHVLFKLKQDYPEIISYSLPNGNAKLAAGWLIEQCGWKGYRKGDAGCHPKQALVLVNYGNASGEEIYDLSEEIKESVKQKFNIDLETEVNIF
jgi:UDP-N-acetylmuramate dehydrogenase